MQKINELRLFAALEGVVVIDPTNPLTDGQKVVGTVPEALRPLFSHIGATSNKAVEEIGLAQKEISDLVAEHEKLHSNTEYDGSQCEAHAQDLVELTKKIQVVTHQKFQEQQALREAFWNLLKLELDITHLDNLSICVGWSVVQKEEVQEENPGIDLGGILVKSLSALFGRG